ncbi:MAG: hypothetical protein F6J96_16005 [Symploca sp. SIO1C2]|nr:hypothetical protein [Symploca sp. SIO1C2]
MFTDLVGCVTFADAAAKYTYIYYISLLLLGQRSPKTVADTDRDYTNVGAGSLNTEATQ